MKGKNEKKNTFVAENACGSHFFCNLQPFLKEASIGEMLEWLKRHAWKACIPLKGIRCTEIEHGSSIRSQTDNQQLT